MALNSNPREELKKIDQCKNQALRDRMDNDFALYRLDEDRYKIPKEEGEWETVITNRATAEANKLIDYLSYAKRKLWIPITEEAEIDRKKLAATERLAIGCLNLADMINEDIPEYVDIQSLASFFSVLRGWRTYRFLIRKEGDKVIPDLAVWDTRNTYWLTGRKRLNWVCYKRWDTAFGIKEEYPDWNGTVEKETSLIEVDDIWGCETGKNAEEGVIIQDKWVKEPVDIGLSYIPIRIKAGRSAPLISDGKDDNIKMVGESFMANSRLLYSIESRLLSYKLTRAGQLAKPPLFIIYDSTRGGLPPQIEGDPYIKGRFIPIDTGKGQALDNKALTPPQAGDIDSTWATVVGLLGLGNLSPVAYGVINQALPAQGIDILTHSTMDALKPHKKAVESDFIWLAQETIRQYINGNFGELELEGYDKSANKFKSKITSKEIDTNWRFECELIPDLLRDKSANLGLASQAVRDRLLSRRSALDVSQLSDDPDAELARIDQEEAEAIAEVKLWRMVAEIVKDARLPDGSYNPAKMLEAQIIINKLEGMAQPAQPKSPSTNVSEVPRPMPNEVVAANMRV